MAVNVDIIGLEVGRPARSVTEKKQWQMWIDDALMQIELRAAAQNLTIAGLNQRIVDYVVRIAVAAHIKKPDKSSQVTKTVSVDDGSETDSRSYSSSVGRVKIDDEFWSMLGLTSGRGKAYAIDTLPTATRHAYWCDITLGGQMCSCGASLTMYEYPLYGWRADDAW